MVAEAYSWGVAPGGMLGVGEDTWRYFLISRPVLRFFGMLVRIGAFPGMVHDFRAIGVDPEKIKRGAARHLNAVARAANAPLIVLDPEDAYGPFADELARGNVQVTIIGSDVWGRDIERPAARLGGALYRVPVDGHFGSGIHELMAKVVARELRKMESQTR